MDITTLFIIAAVFITIIIFFPDIFPYCSSCKKIKPRFLFRIHKNISLRFGYSSNKSVCRKCCRKYGIENLRQFKQIDDIKRRLGYKIQNKL